MALQRQAERAGALHEEALAGVDQARREVLFVYIYVCVYVYSNIFECIRLCIRIYSSHQSLVPPIESIYTYTHPNTNQHEQAAERLRERLSGVEAALQESHMQLSQRLSGAVQRVRADVFLGYGGLWTQWRDGMVGLTLPYMHA